MEAKQLNGRSEGREYIQPFGEPFEVRFELGKHSQAMGPMLALD
jgi:hypothetical protein